MVHIEPEGPERGRGDLEAWRAACHPADFDHDLFFQSLLRRHAGGGFAALAVRLRRVAASAGPALDAAVREANRDDRLPQLRRHDRFGRPVEEVVFCPSSHAVGRVFWGSGVLSVLAEAGNEVASGAIAYLLDQHGEAGHACPVACTAGAIQLVQRVGTAEQQARWLPGLLAEDYDRRPIRPAGGGSAARSGSARWRTPLSSWSARDRRVRPPARGVSRCSSFPG